MRKYSPAEIRSMDEHDAYSQEHDIDRQPTLAEKRAEKKGKRKYRLLYLEGEVKALQEQVAALQDQAHLHDVPPKPGLPPKDDPFVGLLDVVRRAIFSQGVVQLDSDTVEVIAEAAVEFAEENRKLECPYPLCPYSFEGRVAEEELVSHYAAHALTPTESLRAMGRKRGLDL